MASIATIIMIFCCVQFQIHFSPYFLQCFARIRLFFSYYVQPLLIVSKYESVNIFRYSTKQQKQKLGTQFSLCMYDIYIKSNFLFCFILCVHRFHRDGQMLLQFLFFSCFFFQNSNKFVLQSIYYHIIYVHFVYIFSLFL